MEKPTAAAKKLLALGGASWILKLSDVGVYVVVEEKNVLLAIIL